MVCYRMNVRVSTKQVEFGLAEVVLGLPYCNKAYRCIEFGIWSFVRSSCLAVCLEVQAFYFCCSVVKKAIRGSKIQVCFSFYATLYSTDYDLSLLLNAKLLFFSLFIFGLFKFYHSLILLFAIVVMISVLFKRF